MAFSIVNGITRTVGEMYVDAILGSCIKIDNNTWLLTAKVAFHARINNNETDSENL